MSGNTVETTSGNCFQQTFVYCGEISCQMPADSVTTGFWHENSQKKEGAHLPGEISCQMPDNYVITGIWH